MVTLVPGIDNTVGCTSTKFVADAEGEATAYNMEYLQQVALSKAMVYHSSFNLTCHELITDHFEIKLSTNWNNVYVIQGQEGPTLDGDGNKIINVTSKGQALTLLRQRNKIKKDFSKMQQEKEKKVEEVRERNFVINKEMPMKVMLTNQNVSS